MMGISQAVKLGDRAKKQLAELAAKLGLSEKETIEFAINNYHFEVIAGPAFDEHMEKHGIDLGSYKK